MLIEACPEFVFSNTGNAFKRTNIEYYNVEMVGQSSILITP